MISPKIQFINVSKIFHSAMKEDLVLDNLSFEIFAEEFVCILGPSGVGKTMILNLIAGFMKPNSGKVLFNSKTVERPDNSRTLVFQDYALFPWLNVLDNVAFGLTTKGVNKNIENRSYHHQFRC